MNWQILAVIVSLTIAVSTIVAVFVFNARNTYTKSQEDNYKKTIESYKDLYNAQEEKIVMLTSDMKELRELHTESVKMIGQLQGELKSWKELPIRELADHMSFVTELQYMMAKHLKIDHLPEMPAKNPSVR